MGVYELRGWSGLSGFPGHLTDIGMLRWDIVCVGFKGREAGGHSITTNAKIVSRGRDRDKDRLVEKGREICR